MSSRANLSDVAALNERRERRYNVVVILMFVVLCFGFLSNHLSLVSTTHSIRTNLLTDQAFHVRTVEKVQMLRTSLNNEFKLDEKLAKN
jgi:hypothetical protein